MKRLKPFLQNALLALSSVVVTLLLLEILLRFLPVHSSLSAMPVNAADPVAHYAPHLPFTYSVGWNLALARSGRTNNAGYVNDQDYVADPSQNLIAVIGDSFVEALVVPYAETLQGRLAQAAGDQAKVYSFAMSRSALPQYLAFSRLATQTYHARSLVFLIVGNDFDESHYEFRSDPWAGRLHYFRDLPNGELELFRTDFTPSSVNQVLRKSALMRYLYFNLHADHQARELWARLTGSNVRPPPPETGEKRPLYVGNTAADYTPRRWDVSVKSIETFFRLLPLYSGLPPNRILFVVDGLRPFVYHPQTLPEAETSFFGKMRQLFMQQARGRGYEVVDMNPVLVERFQKEKKPFEHKEDFHWNGAGHEAAAAAVQHSSWFSRAIHR